MYKVRGNGTFIPRTNLTYQALLQIFLEIHLSISIYYAPGLEVYYVVRSIAYKLMAIKKYNIQRRCCQI